MTTEHALFLLLRAAVCSGTVTEDEKNALAPELLAQVFSLAQKHDLAHLAGHALKKLGLLGKDDVSLQFSRQQMQAMYRYMNLNREYTLILQTLEDQGIPHIPLKGSILRRYYPQPWMRTSCDIDILVKPENLTAAVAALEQQLQYTRGKREDHDISLYSPDGIHLELHYDTIGEKDESARCRNVLEKVWEHAAPQAEGSSLFCLSDAMFYFYHIAHMAKHFENGGCGIRPLLDLWILRHRVPYEEASREALIKEGGLAKFRDAMEALSEAWFSCKSDSPLILQLTDYLLKAGVYGDVDNLTAIGTSKAGGSKKYLLRRIFMPYNELKAYFPMLEKRKWLTPFCQLVRWARILFCGGMRRAKAELRATAVGKDAVVTTAELLNRLGLDEN